MLFPQYDCARGKQPMNGPEPTHEERLVALGSLTWLLLLPLGWFLTYSPLARQTLFRAVLGLAYVAVAFYRMLHWSAFFRRRDWITLAFVLLSVYLLASQPSCCGSS